MRTSQRLRGALVRRGFAGGVATLALACVAADAPAPVAPRGELPRAAAGAGLPERVVFASVAGLTAGDYRDDGQRPSAMPTLVELTRAGTAADFVASVAPAARYPAHATLVTGERPAQHGIVADQLLGDRGVRTARYWHASHLKVPTLWEVAARAGLHVAALGWPTTVGAAIESLLPDLVPTARGETWLGVLADAATPSLLELARAAGGGDPATIVEGAARDAVLTTVACDLLTAPEPPELLLLFLSQVAPALTLYGPDTPPVRAALGQVDAEIERLLTCLARSGRLAGTALVVTGDSSFLPVHTRVAPNAVLADEGLLTPDAAASGSVAQWSALARSNGGSAFVYADSDVAAVRARRALAAAAQQSLAFRVVSAEEMLELGADPEAWFGLEAVAGFAFGNEATPPLLRPEALRGVGGYLPERSQGDPARLGLAPGFAAWGRGVRPGVRIPSMRQTDVAPTVARLLGLDLGEVDGRPLVGVLDVPQPSAPAEAP